VEAGTGTYFITFVCYGTRLPGQAGAADQQHHLYKGPYPKQTEVRETYAKKLARQVPYTLDHPRRTLVLEAIREVCQWRKWMLLAAHVRTNHVHVILDADRSPELVMNAFKAYASRALNRSGLDGPNRIRWARHGSTRYLWYSGQIGAAIGYVISGQGEPMAIFEAPPRRPEQG
jgi:REP element-mobilizing transposase RayT